MDLFLVFQNYYKNYTLDTTGFYSSRYSFLNQVQILNRILRTYLIGVDKNCIVSVNYPRLFLKKTINDTHLMKNKVA